LCGVLVDGRPTDPSCLNCVRLSSSSRQWYVLQNEDTSHDGPRNFGIHSGNASISDAARVIAALDLLITIDSMPAHLAGALGTPVSTLLVAGADWRWMKDREDSPWIRRSGCSGKRNLVNGLRIARGRSALEKYLARRRPR
jgi:hypothetical protein